MNNPLSGIVYATGEVVMRYMLVAALVALAVGCEAEPESTSYIYGECSTESACEDGLVCVVGSCVDCEAAARHKYEFCMDWPEYCETYSIHDCDESLERSVLSWIGLCETADGTDAQIEVLWYANGDCDIPVAPVR